MSIQSLKLITFFAGHYYQLLLDLTHDYRTGQWPFHSVFASHILPEGRPILLFIRPFITKFGRT